MDITPIIGVVISIFLFCVVVLGSLLLIFALLTVCAAVLAATKADRQLSDHDDLDQEGPRHGG